MSMNMGELQECPSYIRKIKIIGIFNRFDIILDDLQSGINILYGDNGSGKTTVLHIIANALNDDYERFLEIDFDQIEITFNDDSFVKILKQDQDLILKRSDLTLRREVKICNYSKQKNESATKEEEEVKIERLRFSQSNPFPKAAYFPAFRNVVEAWSLLGKTGEQDILARQLFGNFVPSLSYLSPPQIEEKLLDKFKEAKQAVIEHNQEVLSKSFGDILLSFPSADEDRTESEEEIFQQIKQLAKTISKHPLQTDINFIAGLEEKIDKAFTSTIQGDPNQSKYLPLKVLQVYRNALQEIVIFQDQAFNPISSFIKLFNASLQRKKVEINRDIALTDETFLKLIFSDEIPFGGIQYLSSGERQIFTLIYATTHISSQSIVLIDEPEISIHVNTQIELINKLSELTPSKQLILCTHSPTIAGEKIDRLKEIALLETDTEKQNKSQNPENNDEQEDENHPIYANQDEDFGIYDADEVLGNKE